METISKEKLDFLRSLKLAIEIDHEYSNKVPWSKRDKEWFHNDARRSGMLRILEIVFDENFKPGD